MTELRFFVASVCPEYMGNHTAGAPMKNIFCKFAHANFKNTFANLKERKFPAVAVHSFMYT